MPEKKPKKLKIQKKNLKINDLDAQKGKEVKGGLRELSDSTCASKRGGCCDRLLQM